MVAIFSVFPEQARTHGCVTSRRCAPSAPLPAPDIVTTVTAIHNHHRHPGERRDPWTRRVLWDANHQPLASMGPGVRRDDGIGVGKDDDRPYR